MSEVDVEKASRRFVVRARLRNERHGHGFETVKLNVVKTAGAPTASEVQVGGAPAGRLLKGHCV